MYQSKGNMLHQQSTVIGLEIPHSRLIHTVPNTYYTYVIHISYTLYVTTLASDLLMRSHYISRVMIIYAISLSLSTAYM